MYITYIDSFSCGYGKTCSKKKFLKIFYYLHIFLTFQIELQCNNISKSAIFRFLYGDQARFFGDEIHLDVKHSKIGTVSMASAGENLNASQVHYPFHILYSTRENFKCFLPFSWYTVIKLSVFYMPNGCTFLLSVLHHTAWWPRVSWWKAHCKFSNPELCVL